jgi:hypothetical protein
MTDSPSAHVPSGGAGEPAEHSSGMAERMQELLTQAVEDQILEQRQLTAALSDIRAALSRIPEELRTGVAGTVLGPVQRLLDDTARLRSDTGQLATASAVSTLQDRLDEVTDSLAEFARSSPQEKLREQLGALYGQLDDLAAAVETLDDTSGRVHGALVEVTGRLDRLDAALPDLERRLTAHVDEAVLALADALLRRRVNPAAGPLRSPSQQPAASPAATPSAAGDPPGAPSSATASSAKTAGATADPARASGPAAASATARLAGGSPTSSATTSATARLAGGSPTSSATTSPTTEPTTSPTSEPSPSPAAEPGPDRPFDPANPLSGPGGAGSPASSAAGQPAPRHAGPRWSAEPGGPASANTVSATALRTAVGAAEQRPGEIDVDRPAGPRAADQTIELPPVEQAPSSTGAARSRGAAASSAGNGSTAGWDLGQGRPGPAAGGPAAGAATEPPPTWAAPRDRDQPTDDPDDLLDELADGVDEGDQEPGRRRPWWRPAT